MKVFDPLAISHLERPGRQMGVKVVRPANADLAVLEPGIDLVITVDRHGDDRLMASNADILMGGVCVSQNAISPINLFGTWIEPFGAHRLEGRRAGNDCF